MDTWFQLGDRDLATHVARTLLLKKLPLAAVTDRLRRGLGIASRILPMTESRVQTYVQTPRGWLPFQEYFVKRRAADEVLGVQFRGIEVALATRGVCEAIREAAAVVLAPSNPIVSLGPILALEDIQDALRETSAARVAISPIVGGATIKGPAHWMLRGLGREVSAVGVAEGYRGLIDALVLDTVDAALAPRIEARVSEQW